MEHLFSDGFTAVLIRFVICMVVNWGIVHFLYFRKSTRRDFYFTFVIISMAIFFLVYMMMGMDRGKATMGVGLGLFGIFSIMRYRTDTMPVREMTYLFVVVCVSVFHAMAESSGVDSHGKLTGTPIAELIAIDVILVTIIILFESFLKVEATKLIQYDRIELVKPEKHQELIADLEQRLGIKVIDVKVGAIDFLRDMAMLKVTYEGEGAGDLDKQTKIKRSQYAEA